MAEEKEMNLEDKYIRWFSDLKKEDIKLAGGKGANLGEMFNSGFPVPPGFVVTSEAFKYFMEESNLRDKIKEIISEIDFEDTAELTEKAKEIRETIISQKMPEELRNEILEAYEILSEIFGDDSYVRAYFLEPLQIRISSGHGFLSNDLNIDKLIEMVQDGEEEEEV